MPEITYDIQPADVEAWYMTGPERARHHRYNYWLGGFAVSAGLAIIANDYLESWVASAVFAVLGFAVGYLVARAAVRSYTRALLRELTIQGAGTQFGQHTMTIDETGISENGPQEQHSHRWSAVRGVAESPKQIFVLVDGGAAYIVPKRAFASADAKDEFRATVSAGIASNRARGVV